MGELSEKTKGYTNEAVGNIKQGAGDLADDPALEVEGKKQENKGEAQNLKGEIEGALGNKI